MSADKLAAGEIVERAGTADHSIAVARAAGRLRVVAGDGTVLADSADALILEEAGYPPVPYFPASDIGAGRLTVTERRTHCPHKGAATHYAATLADGARVDVAAWSYDAPIAGMVSIAGRVGFYLDNLGAGARVEEVEGAAP